MGVRVDDKDVVMSMSVKIVDEMGTTFVFECETSTEAQEIVSTWLESVDETPLYEITILF